MATEKSSESPSLSKTNKAFTKLKAFLEGKDPEFKKSIARVLSEAATSGIKIEFLPKNNRLSIKNELVERVEQLESEVQAFKNYTPQVTPDDTQQVTQQVGSSLGYEKVEVVPTLWEATIDGNKVTGVRKYLEWEGIIKVEKIGNFATVNWQMKNKSLRVSNCPTSSKESVWFISTPGFRFSDSTGIVSSSKSGVLISKAAGEGFVLLKQNMSPANVFDISNGNIEGPLTLIGSFVTVIS